ncbi:hypothetical protein [Pseudomonas fluorescens]|uniref:hypothetical protein n=1 Tax=Pseudomonas fluorescens TaxID=294 RepID=UPI0007321331|nr:hypothetical protein [Pseudomonas fluorescens]
MAELKVFLYGLYDIFLFPCMVITALVMMRLNRKYADDILVWGLSLLTTLYCYIVYIYEGARSWNYLVVVIIDLLAFSQIGWLSFLLMLLSKMTSFMGLRAAGVWISIVSLVFHGLYLLLALLLQPLVR